MEKKARLAMSQKIMLDSVGESTAMVSNENGGGGGGGLLQRALLHGDLRVKKHEVSKTEARGIVRMASRFFSSSSKSSSSVGSGSGSGSASDLGGSGGGGGGTGAGGGLDKRGGSSSGSSSGGGGGGAGGDDGLDDDGGGGGNVEGEWKQRYLSLNSSSLNIHYTAAAFDKSQQVPGGKPDPAATSIELLNLSVASDNTVTVEMEPRSTFNSPCVFTIQSKRSTKSGKLRIGMRTW